IGASRSVPQIEGGVQILPRPHVNPIVSQVANRGQPTVSNLPLDAKIPLFYVIDFDIKRLGGVVSAGRECGGGRWRRLREWISTRVVQPWVRERYRPSVRACATGQTDAGRPRRRLRKFVIKEHV